MTVWQGFLITAKNLSCRRYPKFYKPQPLEDAFLTRLANRWRWIERQRKQHSYRFQLTFVKRGARVREGEESSAEASSLQPRNGFVTRRLKTNSQ